MAERSEKTVVCSAQFWKEGELQGGFGLHLGWSRLSVKILLRTDWVCMARSLRKVPGALLQL